MCRLAHFLLFSAICLSSVSSLYQSYAIRGKLLCGAEDAGRLRVVLCELDRSLANPEDVLEDGFSDEHGNFSLAGGTAELTTIEPVLVVVHRCNAQKNRRTRFLLPQYYITNGQKALKTFELGVVNLEAVFLSDDLEFSE